MADIDGFIQALLGTLGAPDTPANERFLRAWQASEGGWDHNDATFNPWNSTKGGEFPAINSVGVRAYPSLQTGLNFTKQTMLNGRYPDIVEGLRAGNPYKQPGVSDDLQVWVSGQPNGNPVYAKRILGAQYNVSPAAAKTTLQQKGYPTSTAPAPPKPAPRMEQGGGLSSFQQAMLGRLAERGRNPMMIALMANQLASQMTQAAPDKVPLVAHPQTLKAAETHLASKGVLQLPTHWKGTHVTDGLGWGTKTAEDIMGSPGTPVGAPAAGTIKYFHPEGAQGGGSMELVTALGTFWLGHIAKGLKAGTHVRRGQPLAVISADHPRPHVHIDLKA